MKMCYTLDAETDPFEHGDVPAPFLWGLYGGGDDYREFEKTDDVIKYLSNMPVVVYAHNGGKFDFHFLLPLIPADTEMTVINGRIAKFKIGKCEFRDSYCILPMPLSAYKKDEIDYKIFKKGARDTPANHYKITQYLRSDCVYLRELVMGFRATYGDSLTIAGAAMKYWQKISRADAPSSTRGYYHSLGQYYYGGRVEAFISGEVDHDFGVVDINSAYPHAMLAHHPFGMVQDVSDELPATRDEISRAFIDISCLAVGVFPHRGRDGSLNFPYDWAMTNFHVTGWEYLAALDGGALIDATVTRVVTFRDKIEFSAYVDHFYDIKSSSEKGSPSYIFAKLFLNSLYGKFAANPEKYTEFKTVPANLIAMYEEAGYSYAQKISKNVVVMSTPLGDTKHRYYDIAVAASITGYVRAQLWSAMRLCDGVMYCDTDCIVCADYSLLDLSATKLGAWDVEKTCNYGAIAGKKLYAFRGHDEKWKKASKGVRLTHAEIVRVAKGETVEYASAAPTFSIKRGVSFISRKIKKVAK